MLSRISLFRAIAVVVLGFAVTSGPVIAGNVILDFNDLPPGTLVVSNPYLSQGFILTSTSGGFVSNSPDTGNGSPQTPGNNPFFAGANGLSAFFPGTITLRLTDGNPFSLLSIGLAREFDFDPAPTVTFTGTLSGGGTVSETFKVTQPPGFPGAFQSFNFAGFANLSSVSWDQQDPMAGSHQFTDVTLTTTAVAEPSSLILGGIGTIGLALVSKKARRRHERK
jgi:hypothetical protein